MRNWHSLYEILEFPLSVLFFALCILGLGNLVTNPAFSSIYSVQGEVVIRIGEALMRCGSFIIINFPLFLLIRIVARKAGSAVSIISAVTGYVAYLVITMYFAPTTLPSTAYSAILGISMTTSNIASLASVVHYPLQTGILATVVVSLVTLSSYTSTRKRSDYGFFSFISKDMACVLRTVIFSGIIAAGITFVWPYVLDGITACVEFISNDTTNPINMTLYGILDRILGVFNLGNLIRNPFWFGNAGGTWINMAGTSIAGDVNIWTKQIAATSLSGMSGRFFTPYYVLNMFAIPGLMWGTYSLQSDILERRRLRMLYIIGTIVSMFTGTLLPLEIMLVLLCPILFLFHVFYTGVLFGVFQSMHVYLGFNYTGTSTLTALPGTLMEYLSYWNNPTLQSTLLTVAAVGAVSFVIYFFVTRFYFHHLALDLFNTGDADRLIKGTIKGVGGLDNIKMIQSSITRLTINVYDENLLDIGKLKSLGSSRIYETKAGYALCYGASSPMVREGIQKSMRKAEKGK